MRLFVALCLDGVLRREAATQVAQLQAADTERAVRWVAVSGMHLTLQFLGEVPDAAATAIAAALDAALAGLPAPHLALAGGGAFPNLRRPRVIWMGLREEGSALVAVHRAVGEALAPLGWPPDKRSFQPHLTAGRVRDGARPGRALIGAVEAARGTAAAARPQTEVVLFRSHLVDGPARYERLRTWDLQGSR